MAENTEQLPADQPTHPLLTPEVVGLLGINQGDFTGSLTWETLYGSTAGPFGGVGGAMMTHFTLTMVWSMETMILFAGSTRSGNMSLYGTAPTDLGVIASKDVDAFTRTERIRVQ